MEDETKTTLNKKSVYGIIGAIIVISAIVFGLMISSANKDMETSSQNDSSSYGIQITLMTFIFLMFPLLQLSTMAGVLQWGRLKITRIKL